MSKKTAAYIALSLSLIIFGACGLSAGTIVHPEIMVYQSTAGDSASNEIEERGYLQEPTGAVQIPGVLDIAPTTHNWPNFISADQVAQPYTLEGVKLVKQTPAQSTVPGSFPQHTITQTGSSIRLHWPLMYEAPDTTFTLTIDYSTPISLLLPGETSASELHQDVWKWRVAASVQDIERVQNLFHSLPFGRSGVQLISDEELYSNLKGKLADANIAYLAGDFAELGNTLATYKSGVSDAQIMITPVYPNPTGPGTGIANTLENPVGSILLLDSAFMEPRTAGSAGSADVDAPDMTAVMFMSPKVVTLVGDGWFYVQSVERIGGLKVIGIKAGLSAGMHVLLQGIMSTQGPERLLMTHCEILTTPMVGAPLTSAILPLGMANRNVGGAGTGYLPGFAGIAGLRNSAQLVRTWGKVTDTGSEFFYIDDGSGSRDGTQYTGLRVILPSGVNPPAKNAYVGVTGISSWFDSGGYGFPAVLLGSGDDVTVIKPGT